MSDTSAAAAETAKPKRERKAEHGYINAAGDEVKDEAEATGISYADKATGEEFAYQIPGAVAGSPQTMLAVFGAKTLATNRASQERQARARGEDATSDVTAITERFAAIVDGDWGVTRGEGLPRGIDIGVLVDAIEEVAEALGKPFNRENVLARVTEDAAYRKGVRALPDVSVAYATRMAAKATPTKTMDDFDFG